MSAVKLTDVVKVFEGTGDFASWLKKFQLACKLRKVKDDEMATTLPMFLESQAFDVYDQLDEGTASDYDRLKAALLSAFCVNSFGAYEQLKGRRLQGDESPDVYLADLKKYLSLCEGGELPAGVLRCSFVAGLPLEVQSQVLSVQEVHKKSAEELLPLVKSMLSARKVLSLPSEQLMGAAAATSSGPGKSTPVGRMGASAKSQPIREGARPPRRGSGCFNCGGEYHIARNCPTKSNSGNCFRCGGPNHVARDCLAPAPRWQGNGEREAVRAPPASAH